MECERFRKGEERWNVMNRKSISPICVYTVVHTDTLKAFSKAGGSGRIKEGKRWATAGRLLQDGRRNNLRMLVLFAAAEDTSDLIYYAGLDAIEINRIDAKPSTTIRFSELIQFEKPRPKKTSLIVKSTGRPISEKHIRPYVICKTPKSLMQ